MKNIELRKDRAKLIHDAGEIVKKAQGENRNLNAEEDATWTKMHADADVLLRQITVIEKQDESEKELAESGLQARDAGIKGRSADAAENAELEKSAFRSYLRFGQGQNEAEQEIVSRQLKAGRSAAAELRAFPDALPQTITTTAGGYVIAREFQKELDKAMLAYGPMNDPSIVRHIDTPTGATLDWPTQNDTAQSGRMLAINTQATTTGILFGTVAFNAWKASSDAVLVPVELLQDSAFPVDEFVNAALAERIGRLKNAQCTTGAGTTAPMGIVTAATDSSVVWDISDIGTTPSLAYYTVMMGLEHSVDPAYRPGASWMFNDATFKILKQNLKDSTGQPLWTPGLVAGAADKLMGYPYAINQSMAVIGTSTNKGILFGNMKKFIVRNVRPTVILRLVERYADYHQVGFLAFERFDSNLIDAGTHPIKYVLTQA